MFVNIMVLVVLIIVNAFFASAETALLSVNPNKVRQKADEGDKKAIALKKIIDDPSKFLSAIQVGISFAALFSGAFANEAFSDYIVQFFLWLKLPVPYEVIVQTAVVIMMFVLSYFMLVFGEIVPKRLAMNDAYKFSLHLSGVIGGIEKIAAPFVKLLYISTNFILKLLGVKPKDIFDNVTEEDIRMMVDVGGIEGSIDESEKEMINNVFEFDNKIAEDIATHRKDIVSVSIDAGKDEIFKAAIEKYSRILVYEDNIDNIVGVLHIKDLLNYFLMNDINGKSDMGDDEFNLKSIIRKPYFVPASKKTDELFKEMQKNKIHIAIIVDEYGGTAGIVTMEDLIEEIMGNIFDEYDDEETPNIQTIDNNTFLVNGKTDIEAVSEFFEATLPLDDYDTISGFIIGQLGRIPLEKEKPEIEFDGLIFRVQKIENKRISSVIVCKAE